jgi:hypothetical protein
MFQTAQTNIWVPISSKDTKHAGKENEGSVKSAWTLIELESERRPWSSAENQFAELQQGLLDALAILNNQGKENIIDPGSKFKSGLNFVKEINH